VKSGFSTRARAVSVGGGEPLCDTGERDPAPTSQPATTADPTTTARAATATAGERIGRRRVVARFPLTWFATGTSSTHPTCHPS
jgi:hypothetical protein